MVAIAEAASMAGAPDLDDADVDQIRKAWDIVGQTAGLTTIELAGEIAGQAHIEVANLGEADARAAVLVPREVAARRTVLPLHCTDVDVTVATANPLNQDAKREIAGLTGRTVIFEVAPPESIETSIYLAYGPPTVIDLEAEPSRRGERVRPHGPHVLIVDDEAGPRALFRSILEEAGYRVSVARDGEEAFRIMRSDEGVDLITLDYWMDKMNGLRVLQLLRADPQFGDLPVIMVTGAGDRQIEMSLFEAGADDYIKKPIDGPLFLLRIQAVLRRRQYA